MPLNPTFGGFRPAYSVSCAGTLLVVYTSRLSSHGTLLMILQPVGHGEHSCNVEGPCLPRVVS